MPSRVNLVVVVLITVACVARALEELQICSRGYAQRNIKMDRTVSDDEEEDKDLIKMHKAKLSQRLVRTSEPMNVTTAQRFTFNEARQVSQEDVNTLQESARVFHRKKRSRMLMALLMAYKMKFMALIPTLVGSFILLFASNALAGFFFALFAAVLSLKGR